MDKGPNVPSQDDGAGEKLFDETNGHNSKSIEVKYVTPTSQNGDAKIDIENIKSAFAGMGKEELMKFANDPFWVRTRWVLFILFWLLWLAMLVGAIAIIVLAPKCASPAPREWWEKSPIYKVDLDTFSKNSKTSGLKGFSSRLEYLQTLGVKTIVLPNILKVSDKGSDGIDEFKTISPSYGEINDLKNLISAAKDKGLKLLLTLIPNHSSLKNEFFNKSVARDQKYSSYYVWAPSKGGVTSEGLQAPPNNWLSKDNTSAWEWNDHRKEFYLHQFGKDEPEFNFRNADVIGYFKEVMQFWLNLGISGFYLERTQYLIEDKDLRNEIEKRDIKSATHTEYDFFNHDRTSNVPELASLLGNWSATVFNNSGIIVTDEVKVESNRPIAQVVVQPQSLEAYPNYSPSDLVNLVNSTLASNPWPAWQILVKGEKEGSELSKGLLLFAMLLPGIPITRAGQEHGLTDLTAIPWDNTTTGSIVNEHSLYNAYKKLVESRDTQSFLYGTWEHFVMSGSSSVAYTRIKNGNPGYLVVFNIGSEDASVDASKINSVPQELSLMVTSDNIPAAETSKVESTSILLSPRSVGVYSFVPKAKE